MLITTEQVWDAFHAPLQQFIRRRISDEHTAEDVLQDVFLKIHQHMEMLKEVRKLESWIYQITRNAIIDSYRSSRSTTTLEAAEVLDMPEELPELALRASEFASAAPRPDGSTGFFRGSDRPRSCLLPTNSRARR